MPNINGTAHLYGRYQTPEPATAKIHLHDGATPLREILHPSPLGILDQEDLLAQGIRTSTFVPGETKDVDALGSCTANSYMHALAEACLRACNGDAVAALAMFHRLTSNLGAGISSWDDVVQAERLAISFYNVDTAATDPTEAFPPGDPGSSGVNVAATAEKLGQIADSTTAHAVDDLVSLLQAGGVMIGSPFYNSFEQPTAQGFIDGAGTTDDIRAAIDSGLAGGHETFILGPEKLTLLPSGRVDPLNSWALVDNSWSKSWGDGGRYRVHFSTLAAIGAQCDYRQLTPVAA